MIKTEIDVVKPQQVREATEFIKKYKCPAIVIPPELVTMAVVARGTASSTHKIITTIDLPKGSQSCGDKFKGLPAEALNADGFEILLSARTKQDIQREVKFFYSFFATHLPQHIELRFVLGYFMPDRTTSNFEDMCSAMAKTPAPSMIRTTYLTKISAINATIESQQKIIDMIRKARPAPIKISGNINIKTRVGCSADKFACTLEQAQQLQKDLMQFKITSNATDTIQAIK